MLLEVIVESVADARAAEEGGADRLEVVRDIARGGLTPSAAIVRSIAAETRLPLRAMVRENEGFAVADAAELTRLHQAVQDFATIGVDGIVLGFVRDGRLDLETTRQVLAWAPGVRATFHRAFDALADGAAAVALLGTLPQIDRLLTGGGGGPWQTRCTRWRHLAGRAGDRLTILAGGGLDVDAVAAIAAAGCVREIHVGRAAREGAVATAPVSTARVRQLKERVTRRQPHV